MPPGPRRGLAAAGLRVGYVPGVTPDKWARSWRERPGRTRLRLVPQEASEAEAAVRSGDLDMALVRLPVERDGLHLVRLYDEVAVVVVARDHPVAAFDEIDLADLADEQLIGGPPGDLTLTVEQLAFPTMTAQEAVEVRRRRQRRSHPADVGRPAASPARRGAPTRTRAATDDDRPDLAGGAGRRAHSGVRRGGPRPYAAQLPRLTRRSLFNQAVDKTFRCSLES